MATKTLPPISPSQIKILQLLYTFRYLTTNQIQTLFNHSSSQRTQSWLKHLYDFSYVQRIYDRYDISKNNKPALYFLGTQGRAFLKNNSPAYESELQKIYKAKNVSPKFIQHCITIADLYLYFLRHKKSNEEIQFFTKSHIQRLAHFPQPLPDVYMTVSKENSIKQYLIELYDPYIPAFVIRRRVKYYLQYFDSDMWQSTTNTDFPSLLLVLPDERTKKHILLYAQSVLKKTITAEISFFVATLEKLTNPDSFILWEKVNTH